MKGLRKWMKLSVVFGTLFIVAALAWTLPESTANAREETGQYEMTISKTSPGNPVTIRIHREQNDEAVGKLIENCYAIMTTQLSVPIGGILAFFLLSLFIGLFMTGAVSRIPSADSMGRPPESRNRPRNMSGPMRISSMQRTKTEDQKRIFLFGRL